MDSTSCLGTSPSQGVIILTVKYFSLILNWNFSHSNWNCCLLHFHCAPLSKLLYILPLVQKDNNKIFSLYSLLQAKKKSKPKKTNHHNSNSISLYVLSNPDDPQTLDFEHGPVCQCLSCTRKPRTGLICRLRSGKKRQISFNLLAVFFLIQPTMLLAFNNARALCSLMSTRTLKSFSKKLLPSQLVPSLYRCMGYFFLSYCPDW